MIRAAGQRSGRSLTRPLWVTRTKARAPLVAFLGACVLVAVLGFRELAAPRGAERVQAPAPKYDLAAQAFAEDFARAYLEWDARKPEAHERALRGFLSHDVDLSAAFDVPRSGSERVRFSRVVDDRSGGAGRRIVTIAADTTGGGRIYLAVTVSRNERGLLFVPALPAIVGAPGSTTRAATRPETEVRDRQLRAVASRVVRNYLVSDRADLAADLDLHAAVSLPNLRLRLRSIGAITWVSEPERVAVEVSADAPRGARLGLRYELRVLRVGRRWLVRTIHTNPIAREGYR